jgi:acyl-coenzyme A thioesterase PaaI-like protein
MRKLFEGIRTGESIPHWLDWRKFNVWPALLGTGAHITHVSPDWTELDVKLPLSWRTRNYMGTTFGGSIYASVDPYAMVMLIRQLGEDEYVVWDKSARVQFKRPGTQTLYARFRIPAETVAEIKAEVDAKNKLDWTYSLDLKDADGTVYATVDKVLFVARKDWYEARQARRAARPSN